MDKQDSKTRGRAGGIARSKNLSKEERAEIARRAANSRWASDDLPSALEGCEGILELGDAKVDCFVLKDERRVLSGRGMQIATGMDSADSGSRVGRILETKWINTIIPEEITNGLKTPIKFKVGGAVWSGYDAELLPRFCRFVVEADQNGLLTSPRQKQMARQCLVLLAAFADIGIKALIDEATGYQTIRAKNALAKILEDFIEREYRTWTKTFPFEFYEQMFRLRGWSFDPKTMQGPRAVAQYTDDLVYKRLAPGVLTELKNRNPVVDGRRKQKHHQWLTGEIGHPKLQAHIEVITSLMMISDEWDQFMTRVEKVRPRLEPTEIGFEVEIRRRR